MSVVSYCPFRGKKATGLSGTEKAFANIVNTLRML